MSSRKSKKRSLSPPNSDIANYLPPPRDGVGDLKPVHAPLMNTRLSSLVYLLVTLMAILVAYYSVRGVQMKVGDWGRSLGLRSSFERESGGGRINVWGWWGRGSKGEKGVHGVGNGAESADEVGVRIEELARVLGVPVADLAGAVAGVVASVHTRETTGRASIPFAETTRFTEGVVGGGEPGGDSSGQASTGFVGGVLSGVERFVGSDDDEGL